MGCGEAKEQNYPTLLCFFNTGDEDQKAYCLKVKDNFQHEKAIRFEIKSMAGVPFSIKFKYNGQVHDIQGEYNNSDDAMNESLNKMYAILDGPKKS